jgi:bacterioferritin
MALTKEKSREQVQEQARLRVEDGAVTKGYAANREEVLQRLNQALATELVCVLRYKYHHYVVVGSKGQHAAQEFLQHAEQEQEHAEMLARRIVQLGGKPEMDPKSLMENSHTEYIEGKTLESMLRENLVAERVAIDTYRMFIRDIGSDDPTTRRMLEEILAVEEEHADDLSSLMQDAR